MNKTRHAARELFYTDTCSRPLDEEEEHEIRTKYNLTPPPKKYFDVQVDDILDRIGDEEDGEYIDSQKPKGTPLHPIARTMAAAIVDEIEDDYNLDINNLDPKKYARLNDPEKFEKVKAAALRKISLSRMPEGMKKHLYNNVDRTTSARQLITTLLFAAAL